ncbi:MAG: 2,3-bisphosphoglycerate-independent phosphoglycerate mutase [bacterium]|nr:2,3-bisphosphoglycerate-independent phosphoglycerate mutase [bacterium]
MRRTHILLILDGWGIGRKDQSNPLYVEQLKNIEAMRRKFPSGSLQASGIAVGLPWEEEGNSEVGHLTLGAGRVLYQHYPRITIAMKDGSFWRNEALVGAAAHAKANNSRLHFVGLLTAGNVHASLSHLHALIELAKREGVPNVALQLFTDGKDSPPKSALELVKKLDAIPLVASISGRYYAMDRDRHFDRTERTYRVLMGQGDTTKSIEAAVEAAYKRNLIDEFIPPTRIGEEARGIQSNDAVVFFNFREDSMRQIIEPFLKPNFDAFAPEPRENIYIATMTRYEEKFENPAAFPSEHVKEPLGKALSSAGKIQLRIAETEKYAHVTYFFNGYKDPPFENEYRALIHSKNVPHHDEHPEMMTREITDRVLQAIEEGSYDFILVNFANPDVIAHTGNFEAAQKAMRVVDENVGRIVQSVLESNGVLLVTSDHGNVERMLNPLTGTPETKHDPNPVPVYLIAKEYARARAPEEAEQNEKISIGTLADIAPTILDLMSVPQPKEMSGQSLLPILTL